MDDAILAAILLGDPGVPSAATKTSSFVKPKEEAPKVISQQTPAPKPVQNTPKAPIPLKLAVNEFEFFRSGDPEWKVSAKQMFDQFLSAVNEFLGRPPSLSSELESWLNDGHGPMCLLTVYGKMSYDALDAAEQDLLDSMMCLRYGKLPPFTQKVTPEQIYTQSRKLARRYVAFEYLPDFTLKILQKYNLTLVA